MELNIIYKETCLETLSKMPDAFIDCVITSPPYWQLRDYGYPEQWGLEATYQEYLEHLWQLMDEIYRVLKPSGTVWVNLGDTYNTVSGNMKSGMKSAQINPNVANSAIAPDVYTKAKDIRRKSLCLLPHRFAIGCSDRGWIIRNDIIWAKRNGMPESTTDRFSKKHEYFFFMTKSEKYFFDLDAVKEKRTDKQMQNDYKRIMADKNGGGKKHTQGGTSSFNNTKTKEEVWERLQLGKNPGSVSDFWDIPTLPSTDEHYAVYNEELLMKPILAGCPKGGTIYDPFMGSGTTAIMAHRARCNWIGSEMSEEFLKVAEQNLKPLLSQTFLF